MPGFGLVEALLDAEEARKPKPHPAGLDQKVAYRMLTQLGLEPDVPGGAVEVRQQDTPELFATLVAVGYKPKAYADGGAVVVPPTRKAPSATAQRSVMDRLVRGENTAEREEKPVSVPRPRPKPPREQAAPAPYFPETGDWMREHAKEQAKQQAKSIDRLTRGKLPMAEDLADTPPKPSRVLRAEQAAALYDRLAKPAKRGDQQEPEETPTYGPGAEDPQETAVAPYDPEEAERLATLAAAERNAAAERRREALERLHSGIGARKKEAQQRLDADSAVLGSLGLARDVQGRIAVDTDLPELRTAPDPARLRSLAQPRRAKAQPTRASSEFDVAPDFVEGKRHRGDGIQGNDDEDNDEARAKRTVDVKRMAELAKPVRTRPKSAERVATRWPDELPGEDPAAIYRENLPHRLDPNRPRAVQTVLPAKPTWEAQQAAMRRLLARKDKHAAEEVREIARAKSSDLAAAATQLVAGQVSAELRSYFEEVLWTALSLAREFGAVAELADTVGWCRPAAPEAAPPLAPAACVQARIDAEFPALATEIAKWRVPEDEAAAIARLRSGRDALLRLAQRARRPRMQRVEEEPAAKADGTRRSSLSHWTPDLQELRTPRPGAGPATGLVGYELAKGQ